jgi:diguanylate cyclase (GGDEF)-like protein
MDPASIWLFGTLMILLNGGVLGLLHRTLAPEVRPAALSWRIGTLLFAGGAILLVVQAEYPPAFILPVANACIFSGGTFQFRGTRQFLGLPDRWWMPLPAVLGVASIVVFTTVWPSFPLRVVSSGFFTSIIVATAAIALLRHSKREAMIAPRVLALSFLVVGAFLLVRSIYFCFHLDVGSSITDGRLAANWLTPMLITVLPVVGTTAFLAACSERLQWQLRHAAETDALTGLSNRRAITDIGERRFDAATGSGRIAVAVLDIDHFKSINDRHGHAAGDAALRAVAARLAAACHPDEALGRLGGEEFIVVLASDSLEDARQRAEQFRVAVASMPALATDPPMAPITTSIGVAAREPVDRSYDELLRRADQALYRAKANGRNRVEVAVAETVQP